MILAAAAESSASGQQLNALQEKVGDCAKLNCTALCWNDYVYYKMLEHGIIQNSMTWQVIADRRCLTETLAVTVTPVSISCIADPETP